MVKQISCTHEFWWTIGKLVVNEERQRRIQEEVSKTDDSVNTETWEILKEWKTAYENLYNNSSDDDTYDKLFLEDTARSDRRHVNVKEKVIP